MGGRNIRRNGNADLRNSPIVAANFPFCSNFIRFRERTDRFLQSGIIQFGGGIGFHPE